MIHSLEMGTVLSQKMRCDFWETLFKSASSAQNHFASFYYSLLKITSSFLMPPQVQVLPPIPRIWSWRQFWPHCPKLNKNYKKSKVLTLGLLLSHLSKCIRKDSLAPICSPRLGRRSSKAPPRSWLWTVSWFPHHGSWWSTLPKPSQPKAKRLLHCLRFSLLSLMRQSSTTLLLKFQTRNSNNRDWEGTGLLKCSIQMFYLTNLSQCWHWISVWQCCALSVTHNRWQHKTWSTFTWVRSFKTQLVTLFCQLFLGWS